MKKIFQILIYLCFFILGGSGFLAFFTSCNGDLNSNPPGSSSSDSNNVKQDEDEGEDCRGDEDCEKLCEFIYQGSYAQIQKCIERGEWKVADLASAHDFLMPRTYEGTNNESKTPTQFKADLEKALEDEDGEDNVKDYLKIGTEKWTKAIIDHSEKRSIIFTILKWVIENESVSNIINDIKEDFNIVKFFVEELGQVSNNCIPSSASTPSSGNVDVNLWSVSGQSLSIYTYSTGQTPPAILKDTQFKNISHANNYRFLSCKTESSELNSQNILAYSAEKNKEKIFDIAYDYLKNICDDIGSQNLPASKACLRAFVCWTSWQEAGGGSNSSHDFTTRFWDHIARHGSDFQHGSDDYKDCSAGSFSNLF